MPGGLLAVAAGPDGSQGVAVAVTVVATLVVLAVLAATVVAWRAVRQLQRQAADLAVEVGEVRAAVSRTLAEASTDLARVDDLIGSAEQLTGTVEAASRFAYATVASPVIKVMAITRGTSRAGRRLRTPPDAGRSGTRGR